MDDALAQAADRSSSSLLVYVGNPTQYHSPLFRKLAAALEGRFEVMYGDDIGARPFYNPEVDAVIAWDVPVLGGFSHRFFPNRSSSDRKGFWSRNNPAMIRHVFRSNATHVLVHGYDTLSSWYVYFAALLSGKRIIWRGETIAKPAGASNRFGRLKSLLLPIYFRACERVLYSCIANREYLETYLGKRREKLLSFPCAVDNAFFEAQRLTDPAELRRVRAEHGIPEDHMVIATCSRLTKRKRTSLILDAMARMRSRKVTLLVIGDGPERAALQARASELGVHLVVAGFVGQKVVARLLSISDAFVLLSVYDASPKALNEALNFPIPLIVGEGVGTARDLVREGFNGHIFRRGDEDALTAWLNTFCDEPAARRAMGRANAEVLRHYTLDIDVQNLLEAMDGHA